MAFVGPSDSFEMTYQAIRRCWRFGQKMPVDLRGTSSRTSSRKQEDARKMADELSAETREALLKIAGRPARRTITWPGCSGCRSG